MVIIDKLFKFVGMGKRGTKKGVWRNDMGVLVQSERERHSETKSYFRPKRRKLQLELKLCVYTPGYGG